MKTAFLFPGQGAQTVGMGMDLYDNNIIYKQTFDICCESSGLDLKAVCFEGKGQSEGETVQPAIFAHSVSLLRVLKSEGIDADIYAGLSLGEYTALCAAGVFSVEDCAALVRERGRIMDSAYPPGEGGMLSVIGLQMTEVEETISGLSDVYAANHLSELQIVVSGKMSDLIKLKETFEQKGVKMVSMLSVAGPFHSPLLSSAADSFMRVLEQKTLGTMNRTVYSNALGSSYNESSDIKQLLVKQLCSRVKWHDCVEQMIASGIERYVEIGPSNVLSKLVKRRADKSVIVESVRDAATLNKFLSEQKQ